MTVAQALAVAVMRLRGPHAPVFLRESAHADAQILLAEVLQADRSWLRAHGDEELDPTLLEIYGLLLDARLLGLPVPYLTHKAGFYGREYYVDERVLVPRPESEHLVEAALAELRARPRPDGLRALDVGTGSGALGLTLAAELPGLAVTLTDVSPHALAVAQRNTRALALEEWVHGVEADLLAGIAGRYDAILANLPYVPTADVPLPPDPVAFEPRLALDGGVDGLALYRRLLPEVSRLAAPGAVVLLEAAPATIGPLAGLCAAALPQARLEVRADYAGLDRYVALTLPA